MATGRDNKLVGAAGEYLVAAELCRRGLIATTFTGNVPFYDVIASDERGRHVSIQVKASRSGSWQFGDVSKFFDVTFQGQKQRTGKPKASPVQRLLVVFVVVGASGNDKFYIMSWEELRDMLRDGHKRYIAKHQGVRPKKWDSLHAALLEESLMPFRDNWKLIKQSLR
jgi:hypothetical protein